MADVLTREQRHKNMASIKGKDTRPEMVVRSLVLTITTDYRVRVSTKLKLLSDDASLILLLRYDNVRVDLPERFIPDSSFLAYHNENVFLK